MKRRIWTSSIPPSPNPPGPKALSWITLPAQTVPAVSLAAESGHSWDGWPSLFSALFLPPIPALSYTVQPLPEICRAPASAADRISPSMKLVRLFAQLVKSVPTQVQWAPKEPKAKQWGDTAGVGQVEMGEREKHLRHRIANNLWSHILYLPCSLSRWATWQYPYPSSSLMGNSIHRENTFPRGGRARKVTGLEADLFDSNLQIYYNIPTYFIY